MPREIDEAWIDEAIARYRQIDVLRGEFAQAVAAHVVTIHSPDDSIAVRVTAAGEIVDLQITGPPPHRSSADLARQVQAVISSATEAARWAREKLHAEVFGAYRALGDL